MAHVDVSTGEFRVTEMDADEVAAALETLSAAKCLLDESADVDAECLRTQLESWIFDYDYAERTLREHFKLLSLDGCGLAGKPLAVGAAGRDPALPARHADERARPPRPAGVSTTAPTSMCSMRSRFAISN